MAGRRALYLAILLGCGIFYIVYGQWLAYLLLMAVVLLPWFSLVLSLPAMLHFRISPAGQDVLEMGDAAEFWLLGSCGYPMPAFRGRLKLRRYITGQVLSFPEDADAITRHCGGIAVTAEKVRIFDYLGLFSLTVRKKESKTVLVQPRPLPLTLPEDLLRQTSCRWKPKPGGGFAENHELRLYRPGDNLNQVHWKLSAKTGKLILRESVEPQRGLVLLTMNLRGTPEEIDRKFGRLLWLGNRLLEQQVTFSLHVLTFDGILTFSVEEEDALQKAVDHLLCRRAATEGDIRERTVVASWHYHIGGGPDED